MGGGNHEWQREHCRRLRVGTRQCGIILVGAERPDPDVSSAVAHGWQFGDMQTPPAEHAASGQDDFGPALGPDLAHAQIAASMKRLEARLAKTRAAADVTEVRKNAEAGD